MYFRVEVGRRSRGASTSPADEAVRSDFSSVEPLTVSFFERTVDILLSADNSHWPALPRLLPRALLLRGGCYGRAPSAKSRNLRRRRPCARADTAIPCLH